MATDPTSGDPAIGRRGNAILFTAAVIVVAAFVVSRFGGSGSLPVLMDNVHWTVSYGAMAVLAWIGVRTATKNERLPRLCFAWGATAYVIGQLAWDLQVVFDDNRFPGWSDIFYSCLAPGCIAGLIAVLRAQLPKERVRAAVLDVAALSVAVLALTLALYLPKRGDVETWPLIVMVSYPVMMLGALCLGVVLILSLHPKIQAGWFCFLAGLAVNGGIWMHWNSLTLDNALGDGTWFNLSFSIAALVMGYGAAHWRIEPTASRRWEAGCEGVLRLLPVLLVVVAATSVGLSWSMPGVPRAVQATVGLSAIVVVVLAVLRQSMLLTERERLLATELLIRETEGRFRTLFETAQDAIFIMNSRVFIDCNQSTLRIFGCTKDEIIGHSPVEFSPEFQADGGRSIDKAPVRIAAAMAGEPQFFEWKHHRHDKTLFDAEVSLNRVVLGGRTFLQAIVRDISERKRIEEDLRARTAFFGAQVDSALDGILVVDRAGRKLLQNRRMAELLKIPPEIVNDTDDAKQLQFVTSRTANPREFAEKVAHLYSNPTAISRDLVELVDGTMLDRYSAPVIDEKGTHYGRIWTFRDITEQHRLEQRLRQSQKMEAIGQLSGGIAHDFNNLLTVIKGHIGLLRLEGELPLSINDSISEIDAAADRAAKLTTQLLTFSRQQVLQPKVLNLNDVVTNLTKMLRRLLRESITVEVECARTSLPIKADESMVEQVMLNLVVNARDAISDRGGLFRVTTESLVLSEEDARGLAGARAGAYVCLVVSDTGEGIAAEVMPRIFEPFFTTKGVGKGTGLGLATVYGIMQQHHGWITVDSQVGRGSTFRAYFPRYESVGNSTPPVAASGPVVGGREGILLVEDEPAVREVAQSALIGLGYKVFAAANGREALALWRTSNREIQLLLTDLVMPDGVSGRDLAREIQMLRPSLPVIYMSGYSHEMTDDEFSLQVGVNYLPKPFDVKLLATIVRGSLERRESGTAAAHRA